MALYDFLKDAYSVAQKTQNIELLQAILEAQRQAIELQAQNTELKKLIEEMQATKELEEKIERYHSGVYITFSNDRKKIKYCVTCWDSDRKSIQLDCTFGTYCGICSIKKGRPK